MSWGIRYMRKEEEGGEKDTSCRREKTSQKFLLET